MRQWLGVFLRLDRRFVYLAIALATTLPLLVTFNQKTMVTAPAQHVFDAVEALPPGSIMVLSVDVDPATDAEIDPMFRAAMRHALRKKLKVAIMGLWPQGPDLASAHLGELLRDDPEFKKMAPVYGRDYVQLGYKVGGQAVMQQIGESFKSAYPTDSRGTPFDSIPMMNGVRNYDQIGLLFELGAGDPGIPSWVQTGADRYHVKMVAGCTAVIAPITYPFLQHGQLLGLLGGLKGASEYEKLIGAPGHATMFMLSQSVAHAVIIVFILLGNLAYFVQRRAARREG